MINKSSGLSGNAIIAIWTIVGTIIGGLIISIGTWYGTEKNNRAQKLDDKIIIENLTKDLNSKNSDLKKKQKKIEALSKQILGVSKNLEKSSNSLNEVTGKIAEISSSTYNNTLELNKIITGGDSYIFGTLKPAMGYTEKGNSISILLSLFGEAPLKNITVRLSLIINHDIDFVIDETMKNNFVSNKPKGSGNYFFKISEINQRTSVNLGTFWTKQNKHFSIRIHCTTSNGETYQSIAFKDAFTPNRIVFNRERALYNGNSNWKVVYSEIHPDFPISKNGDNIFPQL